MPVEYSLSFQDFMASQWLYVKHRKWNLVWIVVLLCLLPLAAIGLVVTILLTNLQARPGQVAHFPAVVWLACAYFALIPLMYLYSMWRRYRRMLPRQTPNRISFRFDEEQFISGLPGRSEGRFQWTALESYAEDSRFSILIVNRNIYLPVPRRALSAEEWARFRAFVDEALRRKKEKARLAEGSRRTP